MQESEVKRMWCPMARRPMQSYNPESEYQVSAVNRTEVDEPAAECYGSNCMAWRWETDKFQCASCDAIFDEYYDNCIGPTCDGKLKIYREGFCGLAGAVIG